MTNKPAFFILILSAFAFSFIGTIKPAEAQDTDSAKKISVDQVCELYIDEPMSADSLYKDKTVQTTVKAAMVRKIHSLCSDAPEGTFTMEVVTRSERVVQCFCNSPDQKSVLDTAKGSTLNIQGTFKSMTASFFESASKQCTLTIQNCTFN
jgi:DNA/RNA endonuclease YhcR with UshA esterase domain